MVAGDREIVSDGVHDVDQAFALGHGADGFALDGVAVVDQEHVVILGQVFFYLIQSDIAPTAVNGAVDVAREEDRQIPLPLGGMGVAFYTSLAGAGCSIVLTILRTIFNPQAERERLETRLELWLDTEIAPTLKTEKPKDDAAMVRQLIDGMKETSDQVRQTMYNAGEAYVSATRASAVSFAKAMESGRESVASFDKTVATFNEGVHDFSEVDYNLRGSVERMDLAVRDLASALREINRRVQGGQK